MTRYFPFIILASILIILAFSISYVPGNSSNENGLIGKTMPELSLSYVAGETLPKADQAYFKGNITVLNIFASWCVPCIAELPELAKLYALNNVRILGVAWHDKANIVQAWVKKHDARFHSIYRDGDNKTGVQLGIRGVPETYVVDANGVIRFHHAGPVDAYMVEHEIMPLIQQLKAMQ